MCFFWFDVLFFVLFCFVCFLGAVGILVDVKFLKNNAVYCLFCFGPSSTLWVQFLLLNKSGQLLPQDVMRPTSFFTSSCITWSTAVPRTEQADNFRFLHLRDVFFFFLIFVAFFECFGCFLLWFLKDLQVVIAPSSCFGFSERLGRS